jgi:diguanylate cyclase (GGDEF)-like protein
LYLAVAILLLTTGLGVLVDQRHDRMLDQQREIMLGLERMQRLNQTLTHHVSTAVLERNVLRISGFDNTVNELRNALESVARQTRSLSLAGEILSLLDESARLREQEQAVIALVRSEQWELAQQTLSGERFQRTRKVYEINSQTTAMAVTWELDNLTESNERWRQVFTLLRLGSLVLLLWTGAMFSRRLRGELATQERLRREVGVANAQLEQRVQDRTAELQQANAALEQLSITDSLTGLHNRRHFDAEFETAWQQALRFGRPLAVLMFDVDEFKAYNDHYGHQAGDQCLRAVAAVLQGHARRAGDLSARYGGEEFVVLLPQTGRDDAALLAEKIRSDVELRSLPHEAAHASRVVTVSAGVASCTPERGQNPYALLKAADDALYEAKRQGRNRVVVGQQAPSGTPT